MRIMLDTNVLISIICFPSKKMNELLNYVITNHTLVISSYIIDELKEVTYKKFPKYKESLEIFLLKFSFEFVYSAETVQEKQFEIRDEKDFPILYTAIVEGVDILVTGDKDFSDVVVEKPMIITPSEFYNLFITQ